MAKKTKCIMKLQKSLTGRTMLVYNEDRSIMGELDLDKAMNLLFGDRYKIYCECTYRESDGYLHIGKEVDADF